MIGISFWATSNFLTKRYLYDKWQIYLTLLFFSLSLPTFCSNVCICIVLYNRAEILKIILLVLGRNDVLIKSFRFLLNFICSTKASSVKPFVIQTLHKSSLSRVRKKPIEVKILEVNHKRPLTSTTLKGLGKNFKKVSDDNSVSPKVAKNTFGVLGQFCLRLSLENCSKWDQENIASPNKIVLQTRKNVSNQ